MNMDDSTINTLTDYTVQIQSMKMNAKNAPVGSLVVYFPYAVFPTVPKKVTCTGPTLKFDTTTPTCEVNTTSKYASKAWSVVVYNVSTQNILTTTYSFTVDFWNNLKLLDLLSKK